jgi:hypothetical protein
MVTFVELPLFTEQITDLVDDTAYSLIQNDMHFEHETKRN